MKTNKNIIFAMGLLLSISCVSHAGPVEELVGNVAKVFHGAGGKVKLDSKSKIRKQAQFSCLIDDSVVYQIDNTILSDLRNAIVSQNYEQIKKIGFDKIEKFQANDKPLRDKDGITETAWESDKAGSLVSQLKTFKSVEYVEAKTLDYKISPSDRTADGRFKKANLLVRLDIRGLNSKDERKQDRFVLSVAAMQKDNVWSVAKPELAKGLTLVQTKQPAFEDVTASSGLDKVAVNLRTEAIRRGGYALAVIDYNHDGIPDIFVGHRDNAEVFLGDKDGHFTKIKTPFDQERYTKTAIFADFNNNGKEDAVINRFIATDKNGNKIKNAILQTKVAYYKETDKGYVETPQNFGDPSVLKQPMPSAVADFNGDGLLDIYIGYPGVQDFTQFGQPAKSTLGFQGLYINDGKGGFIDATKNLNMDPVSYDAHLFPHSSLAIDYNQDHNVDLIVLDDRSNLSPVLLNKGGGQFVENAKSIGVVNYNYAMGIESGDINNDGLIDLGVTNVNFSEMDRINQSCMRHASHSMFLDSTGLKLFQAHAMANDPQKLKNFDEISQDVFTDIGEGAGGLTFIDYNNDGLVDIYVTNGLWSGTRDGQDMGSFFSSATRVMQRSSLYSLGSRNDLRFMDILSNLKGTIGDYADPKTIHTGTARPSLAGYQRNRLLRNNGDGTFTDVAYLEGADSMADGYIVGKIDYNHDGVVDLVLRNADPGTTDYEFPAVQLLRNNSKTAKKSVILTFEGKKSGRDGIGLFVKAHAKDWQQVAHLEANSGSMQQQRFIHFGLGQHDQLDNIEVYWPSGIKQVIKNVGPGYHRIVEPDSSSVIGQND